MIYTSVAEKIAVMQAYLDGKPIEVSCTDTYNFTLTNTPVWDWSFFTYRVRPQKPSINWDHVAKEYKYLAVDANGRTHLFRYKPTIERGCWSSADNDTLMAECFSSYTPGTCDWKGSLVARPE